MHDRAGTQPRCAARWSYFAPSIRSAVLGYGVLLRCGSLTPEDMVRQGRLQRKTGGGGNRTRVPLSKRPMNLQISGERGTERGALPTIPADLQALIDGWASLPEGTRAAILALLNAASLTEGRR